ncbi:Detected protein of unknown function [Hibiscus syriacus]|uniref:Uncharacterized protein n=1 Tax=Hibiscus syriacus TaxID=106335 RepID=A0A6A2ZN57_HIBSY|nr:uncharacterized protein LOC120142783 [Hibiscus syriacus]KAE8692602.1 Detected protein of unknown function [Hibiscus syriacus]
MIAFCFLASIPLFCSLVFHELMLRQALVVVSDILREPDVETMANGFFYKLVPLALYRLLLLHLPELCVSVVTVELASRTYTKGKPITMAEMVQLLVDQERCRGIIVTSTYVHFLSTGFMLVSTWLVTSYYTIVMSFFYNAFTAAFLRMLSVALLVKFLEWMAVWNVGIVVSVLEGIHGANARGRSVDLCRGSERRGFGLMLVCFVWGICSRFVCFYGGGHEKRWRMFAGVSLICMGKVMKWMVCVIYYCQCKEATLERVDDEENCSSTDGSIFRVGK